MTKFYFSVCYYRDGDKMKVYFIFNIKDEFINLYKDNAPVLYNILRGIYYLKKEEVEYGYNLFRQLVSPIEKAKMDRDIFIKLHRDIPYIKRKNIHIYNNFYSEISRLTIKGSYIRLEVEQDFSSFFEVINSFSSNFFACDFNHHRFFFLSDYLEKILV